MKPTFTVLLLLWTFFAFASGQKDINRISKSDVPSIAIKWIENNFHTSKRTKWFRQSTASHNKLKATYFRDYIKYTATFSNDGIIEDVSIDYTLKDLSSPDRRMLRETFKKIRNFKLKNLQLKYIGFDKSNSSFNRKSDSNHLEKRFEINFSGNLNSKNSNWAGSFSAWGELLSFSELEVPKLGQSIL